MENVRLFENNQVLADQEDHVPPVPIELVEYLEHTFPDRLPDLHVTDRELGQLIGQVTVVKLLRDISGRRT